MITANGPYVIEYNVRFGDPECQTLLRNLKTDFLALIKSNIEDRLEYMNIQKDKMSVVCVVLASKGYPESFKKNKIVRNISKAQSIKGIEIFSCWNIFKKRKSYFLRWKSSFYHIKG